MIPAILAHLPCCATSILAALGGVATSGLGTGLHALEAYRPVLIAFSVAAMVYSFWIAYRPATPCQCKDHSETDFRTEKRIKIGVAWVGALLVAFAWMVPIEHDHDHVEANVESSVR